MDVDAMRRKINADLKDYPTWDKQRQLAYSSMMYAMYYAQEPSAELNRLIDSGLNETLEAFRREGNTEGLNRLTVLKEVVDRDYADFDQEVEDKAKKPLDFAREFRAALARGDQRRLAQRIGQVRDPKTRENMGQAIEQLKNHVRDEMEERSQQWELEEAQREREREQEAREERVRQARQNAEEREAEARREDEEQERRDAEEQAREDAAFEASRRALVALEDLDDTLNGDSDLTFPDEPIELPDPEPEPETEPEPEVIVIPDEPVEEPEPEVIIIPDEPVDEPAPGDEDLSDDDRRRQALFDQLYDNQ